MNKSIILDNYKQVKEIEQNSRHSIFLIQNKANNKLYVAKNLLNHIKFQKRNLLWQKILVNPAFVKFKGYCSIDFDGGKNLVFVTKYMKNDNLRIIFRNLRKNPNLVKGWNNTKMIINILGISLGIKYMHDRHIVFRDLNPTNILLNSKFYPKINDFKCARYISGNETELTHTIGTPFYMAPEVVRDDVYSFKIDVFGFGMILYQFYSGAYPIIKGKTAIKIVKNIARGKRPDINKINEIHIKELVERCWSQKPEERPSFDEIIQKYTIDRDNFWPEDVDSEEVENYLHKFGLSLDSQVINDFINKTKSYSTSNSIDESIDDLWQEINDDDDDYDDNDDNDEINDGNDDDGNENNNENNGDDNDKEDSVSDVDYSFKEAFEEKLKIIEDQLKTQKPAQHVILDEKDIRELKKVAKIGSGNSSKVYEVIISKERFESKSDTEIFALKVMKKNSFSIENIRRFVNEYKIMTNMNHPNIMKTFGIFVSSSSRYPPSILLEHCSMNLATAIKCKHFPNEQIVTSIYEIAEGMKYIHWMQIIHLDLKPTNIFIGDDGKIKIGDFGISHIMPFDVGSSSQQTKPPEMNKSKVVYNEKVDVYSFGIVVFYILSGGELPKIKNNKKMKSDNVEYPKNFTEFSMKLINECLNFNPKDRPSFEEIIEQMTENDYNLIDLDDNEHEKVVNYINSNHS